ncbi:hypothetical protein [Hyphomicrobium sp. DY-1]|uniref:hypothetical protein n=1 Tax=Hyphomicrobium sp. DY-1 TaxID=3075650 RepID=UPI0039C0C13A
MSELKPGHETRIEIERATIHGKRGTVRALTRLPGKSSYQATDESANDTARRIQREKIERRARRG